MGIVIHQVIFKEYHPRDDFGMGFFPQMGFLTKKPPLVPPWREFPDQVGPIPENWRIKLARGNFRTTRLGEFSSQPAGGIFKPCLPNPEPNTRDFKHANKWNYVDEKKFWQNLFTDVVAASLLLSGAVFIEAALLLHTGALDTEASLVGTVFSRFRITDGIARIVSHALDLHTLTRRFVTFFQDRASSRALIVFLAIHCLKDV